MNNIETARRSVTTRLLEDLKFVRGWLKSPSAVGAIKPTGKVAAGHMAGILPVNSKLPILELGAGTGVITSEIIKLGFPPDQIVSLEFCGEFLDYLSEKFPEVIFVHGDAFDLDTALKNIPFKKYAGVIGAIPLLNVSVERRIKLIDDALMRVEGNGPFVQICYGPKPPVKAIPGKFSVEKSDFILRNLPPASIWTYRREIR